MTYTELLNNVCQRPAMFVGKSDFALAAAFIDGWDMALREQGGEETELEQFRHWLALLCWEKDRYPRNLGWQAYVKHLHPSDGEAFAHLPLLYAQFLTQASENYQDE